MSSLLRNSSELHLTAPPPSPIPTGKGSRSAANEILSEYLEKSLNIPDLSLPDPQIPLEEDDDDIVNEDNDYLDTDQNIPEKIDFRLLELGDYETIDRLLRSAREFGAFMIIDHEIFYDDDDHDLLKSFVNDSDRVFLDLKLVDRSKNDREQISWIRSGVNKRMKCRRHRFVADRYRSFSEKLETIAKKLDTIAEVVGQIFVENIARMQFGKEIQGQEFVLGLYRYNNNHNHNMVKNSSTTPSHKNGKCSDHTLCLHLPTTRSQFYLQSTSGPLSFHAGPDTIVVIVGQRIEEWSMGDFKCVSGELMCKPGIQQNKASFSLELKCLSLNLDPNNSNKNSNTITIRDQILIMIIIIFLYKIIMFLFS